MPTESAGAAVGAAPAGFVRRFGARMLDPTNLAVPVVAVVFCAGRTAGLIADVPYWEIFALLIGAQVVNALGFAWAADATRGWRLVGRVGIEMAVIAVVMYGIGWGAMLAVGFVFGAADVMRTAGSAAARPAMLWTVVWVVLGELAIAAGIAPTLVAEPLVYGLGAIAALGAVMTMALLGRSTAARESSEGRFRALVWRANDIIMVSDSQANLRYVSPAFERVLGGAPPRSAVGLVHPDDLPRMSAVVPHDGAGSRVGTEVRLRCADGTWRWFEATVTDGLDDPDVRGLIGNLHDITERKNAEEALRDAHERFRSAFENGPIGMAIVDLDGQILRANRAYGSIVGRSTRQLVGMNVADLTHVDDRDASLREMQRVIAGELGAYQLEKRYIHASGREVWVSLNVSCVRDPEGRPRNLIGQIEDVTERRTLRERLAYAAIHDPLTGLPNRTLFTDRLDVALTRAARREGRVAVIFLDLDRFKVVNDSLGHAAGDLLLVAVTNRLRAALPPTDTIARFGGDEFTVLCEEVTDQETALATAERLGEALGEPFVLSGREVYVTASLGIAMSGVPGTSASSLMRDADTAMYTAKERGRDRIELFDPLTHQDALDRMRTGNDLHTAIDRGELRVFYQPIVEVQTRRLAGVEALVRWEHPQRGLLQPVEFLGMAEESGLIVPIGAWVLEEACRQFVTWQTERVRRSAAGCTFGVSVNLSPRQLTEPDLVDQVAGVIERTGIEPRLLWLEITEGALQAGADATIEVLAALRSIGVRLSIDDFGSGYSSLGHLSRFPVEALKIDRSFIEGLGRERNDTTIVGSVVSLARSLGLVAVAEGIERPEQLTELRAVDCDYVQGYLLGVPLPADTIGPSLGDDLGAWSVDPGPAGGRDRHRARV